MMRITETVKQLIIINVIVYICAQFVPVAYDLLALHFPANPDFGFWQLASYMFMHAPLGSGAGLSHILFNMLALWMFGSPLEHFLGTKRFLFFYFSCGVGAALINLGIDYFTFYNSVQTLIENGVDKAHIVELLDKGMYDQRWNDILGSDITGFLRTYMGTTVGASGALYGIMVAFAFAFPNAEMMLLFLPIPIKAKFFVPGMLMLDLVLGLQGQALLGQGDGIAHFAHLGGALVGFLMMLYWNKNRFNHNRWN